MGREHLDMPPRPPPPQDLRPDALVRGRARLRSGPVPAEALAAAMLEAHSLLATARRPTGATAEGRTLRR